MLLASRGLRPGCCPTQDAQQKILPTVHSAGAETRGPPPHAVQLPLTTGGEDKRQRAKQQLLDNPRGLTGTFVGTLCPRPATSEAGMSESQHSRQPLRERDLPLHYLSCNLEMLEGS